jgi:hypothetical protein
VLSPDPLKINLLIVNSFWIHPSNEVRSELNDWSEVTLSRRVI